MKTKLTIALMSVFMMLSSFAFASFPVERQLTTQVVTLENGTSVEESTATLTSPAAVAWSEDQTIAILLWFFLGGLAGHRWFLGSPWYWNVLFILTAGFFFVGWVIDGIDIITGSYPGL
jgi:hypothetical protein